MKDWAHVENGVIYEILNIPAEFDISNYPSEWILIDVTGLDPFPGPGWLYDGANFSEPPPPYIDLRLPILAELDEIDRASARPLRVLIIADPDVGIGTPERAELQALEIRAAELRAQLAAIDGQ